VTKFDDANIDFEELDAEAY